MEIKLNGKISPRDKFASKLAKVAEQGICPLCRGDEVDYYDSDIDSDGQNYYVKCLNKECGLEWTEYHSVIFVSIYINKDINGKTEYFEINV